MEWLCALDRESGTLLIEHAQLIGWTPFEIESLENLGSFQAVCLRSGSSNNFPDVFHLWTAQRHGMCALVALENGLPDLVARIRNEKKREIGITTEALRPLDLLRRLGIYEPDPVPIECIASTICVVPEFTWAPNAHSSIERFRIEWPKPQR